MRFPQPVPEIPVGSIDAAVVYYSQCLGFTLDWGGEEGGIAGVSKGDCRLFLVNPTFRAATGFGSGPVIIWINVESRMAADELFDLWHAAEAIVISAPEDMPWYLREFTVADPDGNRFRVFYDFTAENT